MKFIQLCAITLAVFFSIVSSISIPYNDLDDFEIAKLYVAELNKNAAVADPVTSNSQGQIIFPTPNSTWYVGERVNVTFDEGAPNETVAIFFFNKTETLAGGPMNHTSFPFTVPPSALSVPEGGTSLLLAVRRQSRYLQTVDSVVVHVVARAP